LRGQGATEVLRGALLNVNIAEATLNGMTGIPGLTSVISPELRKKYPETFTAKDTEFNELKANFDMAEGRVNVKNLRMSAAEFVLQGMGWVDFTRRIDFPATLTFSRRLSADLTQSAREVKYLLNKQGQLEIPLSISGRLPNVKPKPDMKNLGQVAQRGFLHQGVEELQNRYLGRNESPSREDPPPSEGGQKKRNSTEDAIRRGLESLFKR
jgi:AsmA-like C-terminal region